MMTILLLGKNGQLGSAIGCKLAGRHNVVALGRDDLDLTDPDFLRETARRIPRLALIVNAAAYTAVDLAEREARQAAEVNTFAPEFLALEAKRYDVPLIHFSTDYVFDGWGRRTPYTESDNPNPQSVYAKTKLGGEIAIRDIWKKHLIFRTSGIYGGRNNFVSAMFRLAEAGKTPSVVDDQTVSPNCSFALAEAVATVINRLEEFGTLPWGTYHLSGGGFTTWHGFAAEIFSHYQKTSGKVIAGPIPVSTAQYGAAAARPAYSVLNADLAESAFGIRLPHWKTQFRDYLRKTRIEQGGGS